MSIELRVGTVGSIILTSLLAYFMVLISLPRLQRLLSLPQIKFYISLVSLTGFKKVINDTCNEKKVRDFEPEILILNARITTYRCIRFYTSLNFGDSYFHHL